MLTNTLSMVTKTLSMLTNAALEEHVQAGIALDPRIPEPVKIAASADGDTITLRGTVESSGQRRAAVEDAREVEGVFEVDDQLKVRPHKRGQVTNP